MCDTVFPGPEFHCSGPEIGSHIRITYYMTCFCEFAEFAILVYVISAMSWHRIFCL